MGDNCDAAKMLMKSLLRSIEVAANFSKLPPSCRAEMMKHIEEKAREFREALESERTDDCSCILSRYVES